MSDRVYVVIVNEREKVKRCEVWTDREKAWERFQHLKEVYGWANVCLASREIDNPPEDVPDAHRCYQLGNGLP